LVFCWAYLGAFLPVPSYGRTGAKLPNVDFRKYKVPFILQYVAKQLFFKNGNTFNFYPVTGGGDITTYFTGSNTVPYSDSTGNPGFLSGNVPGPVFISPGNEVTAHIPFSLRFSWNYAAVSYNYLQSKYPALFNMSSIYDGSMSWCGCYASHVNTLLLDTLTSASLGTLNPLVIGQLDCSGSMVKSMCDLSSALTCVGNNIGSTIVGTPYIMQFNTQASTNLDTIISNTTASSVSSNVISAGRSSPNKLIVKQLSGDVDYSKLLEKDIEVLLRSMSVSSPYINQMSKSTKGYLESLMGNYVNTSDIYDVLNKVGSASITAISSLLASKMIGVANGYDEL